MIVSKRGKWKTRVTYWERLNQAGIRIHIGVSKNVFHKLSKIFRDKKKKKAVQN